MAEDTRKTFVEHAALERLCAEFKKSEIFWIARWACVGAAVFAAVGVVFMSVGQIAINGETADLRARLRDIGQDSERQLTGILDAARKDSAERRDALRQQVELASSQQNALLEAAKAEAASRRETLSRQVEQIAAQQKELLESARTEAAANREAFRQREGAIAAQQKILEGQIEKGSNTIATVMREFTDSRDRLRRDAVDQIVASIRTGLMAGDRDLQKRIDDALDKVRNFEGSAQDISSKLIYLRLVADGNKDLGERIAMLNGAVTRADGSASRAKESEAKAGQSLERATSLEASLKKLLEERIKGPSETLDSLKQPLDDLIKRKERAEKKVETLEAAASNDTATIATLTGRIDQLEKDMKRLKYPLPSCHVPGESCKEVQTALAQRTNIKLVIDGAPGPATRAAVDEFRRRIGSKATGELSLEETEQLFPGR